MTAQCRRFTPPRDKPWGSPLILLLLVACPKSDVARPLDRGAPPTNGVADARVLHVDGNVDITPTQGTKFAAKVGTDLVADDSIGAASSSKIVVVLRNGHAVRIDDAGALKVREIVLFQAPPTERPVDEQLKELMDENESLPLAEVRDRAAAWRQMLRAAETAGAEVSGDADGAARSGAKTESAATEAVAVAAAEQAPAKPSEAPASDPAPEAAGESAKAIAQDKAGKEMSNLFGNEAGDSVGAGGLGLRGAGPGGGGGSGTGSGLGLGSIGGKAKERTVADESERDAARSDESNASARRARGEEGKMGKKDAPRSNSAYGIPPPPPPPAQNAPTPATPATPAATPSMGGTPPGFEARFGASAAEAQPIEVPASLVAMSSSLGACIAKVVPPGVSMSTAQLLVEVRDGKTKRVRLSGALPVPLCARGVAVENIGSEVAATRGNSGWLVVTVPLTSSR